MCFLQFSLSFAFAQCQTVSYPVNTLIVPVITHAVFSIVRGLSVNFLDTCILSGTAITGAHQITPEVL